MPRKNGVGEGGTKINLLFKTLVTLTGELPSAGTAERREARARDAEGVTGKGKDARGRAWRGGRGGAGRRDPPPAGGRTCAEAITGLARARLGGTRCEAGRARFFGTERLLCRGCCAPGLWRRGRPTRHGCGESPRVGRRVPQRGLPVAPVR